MKPLKHSVKHSASHIIITLFALLTSACSPVKILNSLVPESGYQLVSAVEYGRHHRQKLDIYLPKNQPNQSANLTKVVIFYYGGNWDSGERADYKFVGEALSAQGYIVVIPDYRVYPEVLFPALMKDPASVAKWVKTNINHYGGDTTKVFLAGHSAGAHIAVMMGVNPEYLATEALQPNDFVGVVGLAGPYDFLPLQSERLKIIFGHESVRWKSQPIHFVDGKNPPLLLGVGKKDGTVWPRNAINLASKIQEKNGLVELVTFNNYGHVDMVAKLAKPLRGDADLLKAIVSFLNRH